MEPSTPSRLPASTNSADIAREADTLWLALRALGSCGMSASRKTSGWARTSSFYALRASRSCGMPHDLAVWLRVRFLCPAGFEVLRNPTYPNLSSSSTSCSVSMPCGLRGPAESTPTGVRRPRRRRTTFLCPAGFEVLRNVLSTYQFGSDARFLCPAGFEVLRNNHSHKREIQFVNCFYALRASRSCGMLPLRTGPWACPDCVRCAG